jgi:hypothetical protein
MMHPLSARSVRAQGRSRRRLLLRPRPVSGEDAIPPETGVEAELPVAPEARTRWLIVTCCLSLPGWLTR